MHEAANKMGQGRRLWIILGTAVLGLTTAATVLTFFLPLVLDKVTDNKLAIGFAVGVEGFAALTIPLIVGQMSDRTWNRFGRRMPYMLAATPLVAGGLVAVALIHTYWFLVLSVFLFFVGYYTYYTAYQSLYPDTLPANQIGRAWAYQSVFQGLGVALALVGGGALLVWDQAAPFVASAVVFVLVAVLSFNLIREDKGRKQPPPSRLYRVLPNFWRRLKEDRNLRLFLPAHFCWEYTLAAIRAFVLLYLFQGLGLSNWQIVPVLGGVIVLYLIASLISGHIADHFDPRRYTIWILVLYTAGQLLTGLATDTRILSLVFPFGMFAGAAIMMLSYPILLRLTPSERHGEYTGYYQFNRGLALIAGTSLTGFLIDRFGHYFAGSDGYQVLWLATGAVTMVSIPFFLALSRKQAPA